MNSMLYYPDFEIKNQSFLKFALLYLDEVRPIIPHSAINVLSPSMRRIMDNTDLVKPYEPDYMEGCLASYTVEQILEEERYNNSYRTERGNRSYNNKECILYAGKYSFKFENYCEDAGIGRRCDEGLCVSEDVAYTYMSILANLISKKQGFEMITDDARYAAPELRDLRRTKNIEHDRLELLRREIEFYVPVDFNKIPVEIFIELRSDPAFNEERKHFVSELNKVLDKYEVSPENVNLDALLSSKREFRQVILNVFSSIGLVTVCALSGLGMFSSGNNRIDFWRNVTDIGVSLAELAKDREEIRQYVEALSAKQQARKYLARLKSIRPEHL